MARISHPRQSRDEIIARARETLANAPDRRASETAIVRLMAELASELTPWVDVERVARALGDDHAIDVDHLIPTVGAVVIRAIQRRLRGEPCRCWRCVS